MTRVITDLQNKTIAVVRGGWSKERDVSLSSGAAVIEALKQAGLTIVDFDPKEQSFDELKKQNVDVAFLVLHGHYGEDGSVQGVLECLKIPYTGSGVLASATCYDKVRTKELLKSHQILMPKDYVVSEESDLDRLESEIDFSKKWIVKPAQEGSTLGLSYIFSQADFKPGVQKALQHSKDALVEEFVDGKEMTVGVLDGKAMGVVEIVPKSGFYDYESKYTKGATDYFFPARISDELTQKMQRISETVVKILGCRGAPRVDFILSKNDEPYFLEVNTLPGMTSTSLLPKSASVNQMDYQTLCLEILKRARLDG